MQLIKANLVIAVFVETLILYCSGGARPAPVPEGDKCAADNADGNGLRTSYDFYVSARPGEFGKDSRQGHPHPRARGTSSSFIRLYQLVIDDVRTNSESKIDILSMSP